MPSSPAPLPWVSPLPPPSSALLRSLPSSPSLQFPLPYASAPKLWVQDKHLRLLPPLAEWNVRVTLHQPPQSHPGGGGGDSPVNPPLMTLSSRVAAMQARLVMTELRTRMPGEWAGGSPTLSQVGPPHREIPSEMHSTQCRQPYRPCATVVLGVGPALRRLLTASTA